MAYSPEEINDTFKIICDKIEEGKSLRSVLRLDDMPSSETFYKWLDADEDKSKRYARSISFRADSMFEDLLDISDNLGGDLITLPDGREVVDNAVIARDKLRVDTRKWAIARINPKKYGDRQKIDHTTKGESINKKADLSKLSPDTLKKIAEELDGDNT